MECEGGLRATGSDEGERRGYTLLKSEYHMHAHNFLRPPFFVPEFGLPFLRLD